MSLKLEQVDHIAGLARLELTDEERDRFQTQLSKILDYFQMLNALDLKDIPLSLDEITSPLIFRDDENVVGLDLKQILDNAPDIDKDQFRIPPLFT
jgi:aspartyl-tRNA(Asn)/glutamyl-tRNA(Gln) amidotransferase subunit C